MAQNVAMMTVDRQLPTGEEIFLDHVGHFVRNPQAAAAALGRVGFTPTPVSVQVAPDGGPTGTGNVCAMMMSGYLEVLFKTADTSLGLEFEAALMRYSGVQLAAFAVADATAWHSRLSNRGFRTRPIAPFQRPVATEAGSATAAFTVARVEPGEMSEGRIQMLTHHTEDAVWQPRWLVHPNGARGLASVLIVVADVEEAAARYSRFTDRPALPIRGGRTVQLDRGRIDLVAREAFMTALPDIEIPSVPFIAGYGVTVASLDVMEAALRVGGVASRRAGEVLVAPFPDELGRGAWLLSESSRASVLR